VNRDLLDDLDEFAPGDMALRVLMSTLESAPTPDELVGQQAALAMFREVHTPVRPVTRRTQAPARSRARARHRVPLHLGGRLAIVSTAVAVFGGFAAAGYAAALPAPLQHVAYRILGFVGVPDASHNAPGTGRSGHPSASGPGATSTGRGPGSSAPGSPSASPTASPSPSGQGSAAGRLTATLASAQIAAGGSVAVTAILTRHGSAWSQAQLSLQELSAGQSGWQVAASAATGSGGQATLTVSGLTTNARFRVSGPDGTVSQELSVVVIPPVSLASAAGSHHGSYVLTARSALARRNDVVELQVLSAGQWRLVRSRRLDKAGLAAFTVSFPKVSTTYRVVLLASTVHGLSVSNLVTVVPHGHGNG